MNTISKMVLWAFLLPFLACLSILFVILIMDALAIHVSSLAESGLSFDSVLRLIGFSLARIVVVAISLSILAGALLASGGLAEHHAWTALKSSGIGLARAVAPLLIFSAVAAYFCFWYQSSVIPRANLNFHVQLHKIYHAEPLAGLRPGRFFDGLPGFTIRVGQKNTDTGELGDVLIYDFSASGDDVHPAILVANRGFMSAKNGTIQVRLFQGSRQEEYTETNKEKHYQLGRTNFDSLRFSIPIPAAVITEAEMARFRTHSTYQRSDLPERIDSLYKRKTLLLRSIDDKASFSEEQKAQLKLLDHHIPRYVYEYHSMYAMPLTCIIFMILGLSLGAVVRSRGKGIGTPALVAVIFFMIFYVLKSHGERLGKSHTLDPALAAWLPVVVFAPLAGYLLWRANRA